MDFENVYFICYYFMWNEYKILDMVSKEWYLMLGGWFIVW